MTTGPGLEPGLGSRARAMSPEVGTDAEATTHDAASRGRT